MFNTIQHNKRNYNITQNFLEKNKNKFTLNLKIAKNKDIINDNLLSNNNELYNKNNKEKNDIQFYNTINNGFSRNNIFENPRKTIKLKLKTSENNNNYSSLKKNNRILNYYLGSYPSLKDYNNNSLYNNRTNYTNWKASSYSKENSIFPSKTFIQKKIMLDMIKRRKAKKIYYNNFFNPSQINYSPDIFESYFKKKEDNNDKIDKFKYKIFLNEKKYKIKKKNRIKNFKSDLNLGNKSDDNISNTNISKNNNIIKFKSISNEEKIHRKIKTIIPSFEKKDKKIQIQEISISPNNIQSDIKVKKEKKNISMNNNLIENLFTDKKKMFHPPEKKFLNNLNLLYSENEEQFNAKYLKHINKKLLKGLCLSRINSSPKIIKKNLTSKINLVKDKLSLVKSIIDFTYPEIIIRRSMRQTNNIIHKYSENIIPYKLELMKKQLNEQKINEYYSSLLKIFNSSNNKN